MPWYGFPIMPMQQKTCKMGLRLMEFDFDLIHNTGVKHWTADTLSPLTRNRTDDTLQGGIKHHP